jgi:hypothetical protein
LGLSAFGLLEARFHFMSAVILGLDPRIERGCALILGKFPQDDGRGQGLPRPLTPALKTWRKKPSTGCEYS